MLKSRWLLVFFVFLSSTAGAQILNDSTVNVYGPKSTGFFYEKEWLSDDSTLHHPDTLINDFHYMSINKANGWFWQDLGNEGMAARTLYFKAPNNAFTESGFSAFAPFYAPKLSEIKYFDTHSPYTEMAYVQNSRKMTNLGLTHSQNIRPNWNMTLNVNRILSAKQYSATTSEDRLMEHWDYTLNTNFTSKNKKYQLLAALVHFNHIQHEQGGISVFGEAVDSLKRGDIKGDYNTEYQERLTEVKSQERWNDFHLFHQLKLAKGLSVFHTFDFQHHKYFYSDTLVQSNNQYLIYPDTATAEKIKNYYFFHNYQNRVGLKGFYKGFKYDLGLTARIYGFDARHEGRSTSSATEILVGGRAGYWFADSSSFLDNEVYIGYGSQNKGNFYLNSELKIKNYTLGFRQVSKPAPLLYTEFSTPVAAWNQNMNNTNTTTAFAQARIAKENLWFVPKMTVHWVSNYLYFSDSLLPQQSNKKHLILNPDVVFGLRSEHWKVQNRLMLNWVIGDDRAVFALPPLMDNLNVEYNFLYAKVLRIYLGTDIYLRPAFQGLAYSPLIQNFYYDPKAGNILGVPVADIYANFMIKRVKLAFGFNYINKGLPTSGFFSTPNYLGLGRAFYLKVNWPLFN
ncbi:putative porin [Marinilongibacter aquaticus]|uniref:putative porin n=1 Tax=Marinilongibacter aquaticus TaxID=2975157 RepID=UPI0021BD36C0|nr:putative porin [Marinilongibacter aquaticus]UBM59605.1 putative porin [Marinilongibacter aquaticus]